MENNLFPSKSSFAVFVWLTLSLVAILSFGNTEQLYSKITATVDHSLARLLNIQNSMLPYVTEKLETVSQIIESLSIIGTANATEGDESPLDPDAAEAASAWLFKSTVEPTFALPEDTAPVPIPKNDLQCMADNIYYEAGNQSYVGKIAVGQVVLNRLKSPSYPRTICGVIYEGSQSTQTAVCQFSWTCSKRPPVVKNSANWIQSLRAANELLANNGKMIDIIEGATSFHASYIKPAWAKKLKFVTQIDGHLFYAER